MQYIYGNIPDLIYDPSEFTGQSPDNTIKIDVDNKKRIISASVIRTPGRLTIIDNNGENKKYIFDGSIDTEIKLPKFDQAIKFEYGICLQDGYTTDGHYVEGLKAGDSYLIITSGINVTYVPLKSGGANGGNKGDIQKITSISTYYTLNNLNSMPLTGIYPVILYPGTEKEQIGLYTKEGGYENNPQPVSLVTKDTIYAILDTGLLAMLDVENSPLRLKELRSELDKKQDILEFDSPYDPKTSKVITKNSIKSLYKDIDDQKIKGIELLPIDPENDNGKRKFKLTLKGGQVYEFESDVAPKGETGTGIYNISKISTSGLVDTYSILFTDNTFTTFEVTNGTPGAQGIPGEAPYINDEGYWQIGDNVTNVKAQGPIGPTGYPLEIKYRYTNVEDLKNDPIIKNNGDIALVTLSLEDGSTDSYLYIYFDNNYHLLYDFNTLAVPNDLIIDESTGKLHLISNTELLGEGIDFPDTGAVQLISSQNEEEKTITLQLADKNNSPLGSPVTIFLGAKTEGHGFYEYEGEALPDTSNYNKNDVLIYIENINNNNNETINTRRTAYYCKEVSEGVLQWAAMEGNYSADTVYFDGDFTFTTNIGTVTGITSSRTVEAKGKTLTQFLSGLFAKEEFPTVTSRPQIQLISSGDLSGEVGTIYILPLTILKISNVGSYTYGPATGIKFTTNNVTLAQGDISTATNKVTNTEDMGLNSTLTLNATALNDSIYVDGETHYKFNGQGTHTDGAIPVTNTGNSYPSIQIKSATIDATELIIKRTGLRYMFAGSTSEDTITSEIVRSFTYKRYSNNLPTGENNAFEFSAPNGATKVVFTYPVSATTKSPYFEMFGLAWAENSNFELKDNIQVADARGTVNGILQNPIEYKTYMWELDSPLTAESTSFRVYFK